MGWMRFESRGINMKREVKKNYFVLAKMVEALFATDCQLIAFLLTPSPFQSPVTRNRS